MDGVRAYKRSSEKQQAILSSILNNAPPEKKFKSDQPAHKEGPEEAKSDQLQSAHKEDPEEADQCLHRSNVSTPSKPVQDLTVNKENMPAINFNGCSNVSVNYYFK